MYTYIHVLRMTLYCRYCGCHGNPARHTEGLSCKSYRDV